MEMMGGVSGSRDHKEMNIEHRRWLSPYAHRDCEVNQHRLIELTDCAEFRRPWFSSHPTLPLARASAPTTPAPLLDANITGTEYDQLLPRGTVELKVRRQPICRVL